MKLLFLSLILTLAFGNLIEMNAQHTPQTINVSVGKQNKATSSKITVKFVSLIEDSRCPEGTNCIWAGNARIEVKIKSSRSGGWKTFEMNTTVGQRGGTLDGYAINLISLTPTPKENVRINRNAFTATFTVVRLSR